MRFIVCFLTIVMLGLSGAAWAQRAPCSGLRGGVVRCDGGSFMCADGRVSKSKKSCQASDYAQNTLAVVGQVQEPEKPSYTIISWVLGVLAVLLIALVLAVRGLLRYYNARAAGRRV